MAQRRRGRRGVSRTAQPALQCNLPAAKSGSAHLLLRSTCVRAGFGICGIHQPAGIRVVAGRGVARPVLDALNCSSGRKCR